MKNRFLAILLSLVMLQAMLPVSAFAADEAGDAADEADEAAETVEDVGQAKLARVQNTDPNFEIDEDGVLVAYHGPGGYVIIPDGVTAIGDYVFTENEKVTGVNIPESVTYIGESAFAGTSLTSITIPASVTMMGAGPFAFCIYLTEISVAAENLDFQDIDGVLFDDTGEVLIQYPAGRTGEYEIPEDVVTIAEDAFRSSQLSEIYIPEGVTTIKEDAFWSSRVREFYIPASVTTIGDGALGSVYTEYIWVDENNNDFVTIYGALLNDAETRLIRCFATMEDTYNCFVPNSVTSIDSGAFAWCRNLTKVVIPNGVTTIKEATFQGSRNLVTVVIPDSVTNIDGWAFNDCDSLMDIYYTDTEAEWNNITVNDYKNEDLLEVTIHYESGDFIIENGVLVEYIGQGGAVTIPDGVTAINESAFNGADTVTSISIPASVTTIEDTAFIFGSINSFTVDSGNANYSSDGGVLFNKDKTELVKVPTEMVGPYTIPDTVTTIGASAFRNCYELDSVTIPEGVTTIEEEAFWSCDLSSIEIPASVTSIGEGALGISGLEEIRVADGNEYFVVDEDGVLFNKDKTKLIRCPVDKTEYDIPAGVAMIGGGAFVWCDLLEDVTIPNSVTTIGDSAFQDCAFTSISIPDSVTYIGYGVFYLTDLGDVYYAGSQSDWNRISIKGYNEELYDANIHFGRTSPTPSDDEESSTTDRKPKEPSSSSSTEKKDETPVTTPEQPVTPPVEENNVGQTTTAFQDVPSTEWYNQAVTYVSENNIMSGSNGRFSPNERLTRGMMAQILYNIENATASGAAAFPDVAASDWFATAVSWVSSQNYMSGYSNGRFGPNDNITREQLAVILYRYAQAKGYDVTGSAELSGFADGASVASWSADAVRWAVSVGLLSGKSGSRLDPAGPATRAEVAQILMNFATRIAQ